MPDAQPWLDWLNTAPVSEIEAELRAELGERPGASSVATRCMRVVYEFRARGKPFKSFEDFTSSKNIGRDSRRAMRDVLGRHGFEAACRHCPVHCLGEKDEP